VSQTSVHNADSFTYKTSQVNVIDLTFTFTFMKLAY